MILLGGGIAFLNASKELDKLQITNSGQKIGVQIIQDALKVFLFFLFFRCFVCFGCIHWAVNFTNVFSN